MLHACLWMGGCLLISLKQDFEMAMLYVLPLTLHYGYITLIRQFKLEWTDRNMHTHNVKNFFRYSIYKHRWIDKYNFKKINYIK